MPTLKWSDVWLLLSLHLCAKEGEGRLDVPSIVAAADGINHAILSFEEFNNGLYRLREGGLIVLNKNEYALTLAAKTLLRQFSGQSYLKQMASICRNLGAEEWSKEYDPNALESPELFISKGNFNNGVLTYRKQYGV